MTLLAKFCLHFVFKKKKVLLPLTPQVGHQLNAHNPEATSFHIN